MPAFRSAVIDGRPVLIPDDPAPAPRNPPLTALNDAYREAEAERRDETEDAVHKASSAMRGALSGRTAERRTQKQLRPPSK